MPQNDLLPHKNTVLFITHGGANGQMEAIVNGVPMISIGVMREQIFNSKRIEYHGYGKHLILHEFTSDDLRNAISEVTTNRTYYDNTQRCAQIIKEFPSAAENVVFWVNHILKFGGSHLHSKSLDMPLYKLFMFDVLAVILFTICAFLTCICCICYCCVKKCCKTKTDKSKVE